MATKTASSSIKRFLFYISLLGLLLFGVYGYRLIWGVPLSIDHFADRGLILAIRPYPELITFLGMIENTALDFHSDKLSDLSPTSQAAVVEHSRGQFEMLQQYDRSKLSGQQAVTYDYLYWRAAAKLQAADFPYHFDNEVYVGPYPANQTQGQQDFPLTILAGPQRVVDVASAERYLARMEALAAYLDNLQAAMAYRADLGVIPPAIIMQRLIEQAEMLVNTPAAEWGLYVALKEKLSETDLAASEQAALLARNAHLIETLVIPAYGNFLGYLQVLAVDAPEEVGLWHLADGLAYYQTLLRFYTSTEMSADEIHALGLRRVAEISEEMDLALQALGYTQGSIKERLQALAAAPGSTYQPGEGVREEMLAEYTRLVSDLQARSSVAFRDLPPQEVVVLAEPPETELGAAGAHYSPPALDGSSPGIFFVNLRDPAETQRFAMRTLAAHEAVPGHHFQLATQQNLQGLPLMRNVVPSAAYSEGWALYTERLVYELGLHDDLSNIGRLQAEMFRAVRLVVDSGMHARRWTREEAIDYMRSNTGMTEGEVVSEIERYIAMPGQACAYMVGMLEILALREEARERQGEAFNLPDFHAAVLGSGSLPLAILRREVERALPAAGD
jgi:uncharacterized protein (DUF885 family)